MIATPGKVEAAAQARVLAEVPVTATGEAPSPLDEAFLEGARFLRAALQSTKGTTDARSILVVPAGTVPAAVAVTRQLARSFGEANKSVIRIDAYGFIDEDGRVPGFADYVTGSSTRLQEIISGPDIGGVWEVWHGSMAEFDGLKMDRLERLVGEARGMVEYVIFGGATPSADEELPGAGDVALSIARTVNGTVVLADSAETHLDEIRATVDTLRDAGARVLGIGLCRRPSKHGLRRLLPG